MEMLGGEAPREGKKVLSPSHIPGPLTSTICILYHILL